MERLKFRAWDKKRKEMFLSTGEIEHLGSWFDSHLPGAMADAKNIDIMQSTGLKDKDCVEIYEGDIVTGKLGKIAEVKWLQEHCAYVGYCWEDNKYYYLECGNERFENVVIIGNIFDNPELLESGE